VDLADGDEHEVGNVRVAVLHTPGHTPDSVCLVVTDLTRAPEPWFVLTGDTLFSGGVGRPDLLGDAAAADLAGNLYDSLFGKLLKLPDHLEVHPAHFGGAACGKGLSGKPGSTLGFERRFNPALQHRTKPDFVRFVLADLPPEPSAFAENRRLNLAGE
jgi:glyoxylase-like metal-dependent hydrolase (beta-lactamase superfamily II)